MLIFKALHIISLVAWFAALFYLPRLFVYHTQVARDDQEQYQRFCTMELKLYKIIATPALISTVVFGVLTKIYVSTPTEMLWPHIKYTLVLFLIIFHFSCSYYLRKFAASSNTKPEKFFRYFNEIPTLFLIGIVLLSVLKPF